MAHSYSAVAINDCLPGKIDLTHIENLGFFPINYKKCVGRDIVPEIIGYKNL